MVIFNDPVPVVHDESSYLAKDSLRELIKNGENVILPKVGHDTESIHKLIRTLKGSGYTVDLVHVGATPEIGATPEMSRRRNIQRFLDTGRLVEPSYLAEVGDRPRRTAYLLRGEANDFADYDTAREPAELVEGSGPIADAIRTGQLRTGVGRVAGRTPSGTEGAEGLLGQPVPGLQPHRVSAADGSASRSRRSLSRPAFR
jgi:hypothetical protein